MSEVARRDLATKRDLEEIESRIDREHRARGIEDWYSVLHRDFTEHAQDYVLHSKP